MLVLIQMPHLHSALICTFARVGPRFERPYERGLSHFVEHTLFNGSQRYPTQRELFEAVEDIGGEFNAVSSYEHAMFWLRWSDYLFGLRDYAGKTATLRLEATTTTDGVFQLIGYLPGRDYGTDRDEQILMVTHTDGPSITQDNGSLGILAAVRYFSNIPQENRPRTLALSVTTIARS